MCFQLFRTGLDFPIGGSGYLEKYYCFGLQPWDPEGLGEIHGGIDLVARVESDSTVWGRVPVISPCDARVERIIESVSGDEATTLVVVLKINRYWYVVCNFEPQTINPEVFAEQRRSIAVLEGKKLRRGQLIGELIVGDIKPGSYPHLHYGFFYKDPAASLEEVQRNYLSIRRSDGSDLAPTWGFGSPWWPRNLGRETVFFCPYEYSTRAAKSEFNSLPRMDAMGHSCRCICAYGSIDRDCGVCA